MHASTRVPHTVAVRQLIDGADAQPRVGPHFERTLHLREVIRRNDRVVIEQEKVCYRRIALHECEANVVSAGEATIGAQPNDRQPSSGRRWLVLVASASEASVFID